MQGNNNIIQPDYSISVQGILKLALNGSLDFGVIQLLCCTACKIEGSWSLSDYRLIRRLEFRADYSVLCKHIDDKATKSLVMNTAEANYQQIEQICGNGMFVIGCIPSHVISITIKFTEFPA